ncbi:hypothetical protein NI17_024005 (plasmid) [Thermobifida halotolerans]|uniref:Uncharacterized protein n=1 Tax=Thermobifida halotolerans TaxID=483545 RepID=A0AA97M1U7_9ACTN|nr:hypothetical protein NI17_024005 [Thermobifida halotolerans]
MLGEGGEVGEEAAPIQVVAEGEGEGQADGRAGVAGVVGGVGGVDEYGPFGVQPRPRVLGGGKGVGGLLPGQGTQPQIGVEGLGGVVVEQTAPGARIAGGRACGGEGGGIGAGQVVHRPPAAGVGEQVGGGQPPQPRKHFLLGGIGEDGGRGRGDVGARGQAQQRQQFGLVLGQAGAALVEDRAQTTLPVLQIGEPVGGIGQLFGQLARAQVGGVDQLGRADAQRQRQAPARPSQRGQAGCVGGPLILGVADAQHPGQHPYRCLGIQGVQGEVAGGQRAQPVAGGDQQPVPLMAGDEWADLLGRGGVVGHHQHRPTPLLRVLLR